MHLVATIASLTLGQSGSGGGTAFNAAAWQRARKALPSTAAADAAAMAAANEQLPSTRSKPWPVMRGSACAATRRFRVVFMFTSTPTRAARVPRVLANMRAQSLKPDVVVLAIPHSYARPPLNTMSYDLPPAVAADPLLQVVRVDRDAGPLTKYLGLQSGTVARRSASDIVVVGDDDMTYGSKFVEDFACAVANSPDGVVVSSGRDKSCEALGACVMGFRGVAVRAGMLDRLVGSQVPPECFLADDVFVTHHFLSRRFEMRKLRTRTKYTIDAAFAWSNESINAIHRRHQYTINRACVHRMLLGEGRGRRGKKSGAGSFA